MEKVIKGRLKLSLFGLTEKDVMDFFDLKKNPVTKEHRIDVLGKVKRYHKEFLSGEGNRIELILDLVNKFGLTEKELGFKLKHVRNNNPKKGLF
ncbi:MAG: hypothetical protein KAS07_03255 [Candidatus Pacebacteria bacterium]|nr:hypothetical protein [Candidatus Paceibacterota bacterium]